MFVSPKGFPQITSTQELKEWLFCNLTVEQRRCSCGNMFISKVKNRDIIFANMWQGVICCVKCYKQYRIKDLLKLTRGAHKNMQMTEFKETYDYMKNSGKHFIKCSNIYNHINIKHMTNQKTETLINFEPSLTFNDFTKIYFKWLEEQKDDRTETIL